jgi:hypothetical protein
VALLGALAAELDEEPALALRERGNVGGMHAPELHVPDQLLVYPLEADGFVLQDLRHVVACLVDARIAEHEKRARGRAVNEAHLRLQDGAKRPLAANDGAGDVEALLGQEVVEVVARDAARYLRVTIPDQISVAVAQLL